jgi:acetylornithine/LysW-gamma-L-lysine aminotransferase
MTRGDHSTTFGGNPLACSAASAVIDYITENDLVNIAKKLGLQFKDGLIRLSENHKAIREVRGLGLMLGLEMRFDIQNIILKGLFEKLILLYSGKNIIRFLPPLVITEKQIEKVIEILDVLIEQEEKTKFVN